MQTALPGEDPIEAALRAARENHFPGLELCIAADGVLSVTSSREECQKIRDAVDRSGVIVETLASGMTWGVNPVSDDPAVRRLAIEQHAAALQRAAWLGCKALLFVPGAVSVPWNPAFRPVRYDKAIERAREAVGQLLETAERVGVDLLLENVWNGMFYSPLELAAFVDSFGAARGARVGVYFDVGNVLGYHQYPQHWIEILGQRIRRVHIKDFKRSIGNLAGFCDLLAGDVPWPEVMGALRGIGYDRTIVAEMGPWDETLLARTSAAMDKILAM